MATKNTAPDWILMNGRMATQDERRSFAQAVAIQDGQFASVGSTEQIMALRGAKTEVIDLVGKTVIPGLNDSHVHPIRGGLNVTSLDLSNRQSYQARVGAVNPSAVRRDRFHSTRQRQIDASVGVRR